MPRRKPLAQLVALTVASALLLAACGGTSSEAPASAAPDLNSYYSQKLSWETCGGERGQACTSVKVPLDYNDLGKGDLEIAVARTTNFGKSEAESGTHEGAIFTNPGGPGASGIEYLPYMVSMLGPEVLAKFDVVSFDPRGVGRSAPAKCLDTAQMDSFMANLGTPNQLTSAEVVAQSAATMGAGCEAKSARITPYLGTNNTARDMDLIRGALGEAKLDYFGASYGSNLGQVYATLFADKVGKFVFDGVVPMWFDLEQTGLGQAKGFDTTFGRFVENCPKHTGCPLPADTAAAKTKVKKLLSDLGAKTLPAPGDSVGRELTQALAYNGIISAMYDDDQGWSSLRKSLKQAFAGDGTGLLSLSDEYADRDGRSYGGILESYYAVSCLDQGGRADATQTAQLGKQWEQEAPMFGDYMAWTGLPCDTWPAPVDLAPDRDNWSKLPAMLLINYSEDPATPYQWADEVAKAMPQASLVKVPGASHVAVFDGIKCVDDYVQEFYLAGKLPASRATCAVK